MSPGAYRWNVAEMGEMGEERRGGMELPLDETDGEGGRKGPY